MAIGDLVAGSFKWRLWGSMGWQDIKLRYRRSVLGPFWLTLSMAILVGTLGFLYGTLFGIPVGDYLPFLALGFLAWGLISGVIHDGCGVFINSHHFIMQVKLPYSVYVYRALWRNLIIFAHNFVVYIAVAIWFNIWAGAVGLMVIPGLILVSVNAIWVGLLFGLICTRFRDVPTIIASLLQVAFFLTPIIWKPELLGNRMMVVNFNPFYHFTELIRAPLLGQMPTLGTWIATLTVTVVGWGVTLCFYQRFRSRIPYWL